MIETARLVLRPFTADDVPAMVAGLDNFAVARNTGRVPFPYGEDEARAFLKRVAEDDTPSVHRAIALRSAPERLIGGIGLVTDTPRRAELGYWLTEPLWGRGLITEAARAFTDHAFGHCGFATLLASVHIGNEASRRILLRLGFAPLGEGTSFSQARGEDVPVEFMELERRRWRQNRITGL